jgi:hypothetical protein
MATLGTFVTGQVLTAAELNAIGTWTTYTPTWTNVTVGNGTVDFKYSQLNDIVIVRARFTMGSTSSITGIIRFTLPTGLTAANTILFAPCRILDAGVAGYVAALEAVSTSQVQVVVANTAGTYGSYAGTSATVPFTWGNGDLFEFVLIYEV